MMILIGLCSLFGVVLAGVDPLPGTKLPEKIVFHRRAELGNNQLTSRKEALAVCESVGAVLATKHQLIKFLNRYSLQQCGIGGCGYTKSGKIYDPGCGAAEIEKCPDDPNEQGLDGYDVYCYGKPPADKQEDIELPVRHEEDVDGLKGAKPNQLIPDQAFCHLTKRACATQLDALDIGDVKTVAECLQTCLNNPKCMSVDIANRGFACVMFDAHCVLDALSHDMYVDYFEIRKDSVCPPGTTPLTKQLGLSGEIPGLAEQWKDVDRSGEEFEGTGIKFCVVGNRKNRLCRAYTAYAFVPEAKTLLACKMACLDDDRCTSINFGGPEGCGKFDEMCNYNGLTKSGPGTGYYSKKNAEDGC